MADSYQLEIHIGYVYGRKEPPANASLFTQKFVPGARLPHAWIRMKSSPDLPSVDVSYVKEFSKQDVDARRYSTLDLCPFDCFTLVAGSQVEWKGRFRALEASLKDRNIQICLRVAGEDFEFVEEKAANFFATEIRLDLGGGLLMRPDQHILQILRLEDGAEEWNSTILSHLGH